MEVKMQDANVCAKKQAGDNRLSKDNAALLLVDHQTGLFQLVRDYNFDEFKNNVLALADVALLYKLPVVLTTSQEQGPNGPIFPYLKEKFSKSAYIARPGEINAWDNKDFVDAVKATGRQKLIIAGIVTDVCVAFPTLSALSEGYSVYVVVDASGTFNTAVRDAALTRMVHAGAILTSWFALSAELQRDWRHAEGKALADLYEERLVPYGNLIISKNPK